MNIVRIDRSGPIPIVYIDVPLMVSDRRPRAIVFKPMDPQRRQVYRWERSHCAMSAAHGCIEDLDSMQEWIAQIWLGETARHGVLRRAAPVVEPPRARQVCGIANLKRGTISIPAGMRTCWVILHELAHHLAPISASGLGPIAGQPHGAHFVGVLIGLLHRHLGLDCLRLSQTAIAAGMVVESASIKPSVRTESPVCSLTESSRDLDCA